MLLGCLPADTRILSAIICSYTPLMMIKSRLTLFSVVDDTGEQSLISNEGLARIQYKCLVPIYVFPEMKLRASLFPKQNYNVLSPNFHIHVSMRDLYIAWIGLPTLLQPNRQTDPGNI
jgi:hypothetical protein